MSLNIKNEETYELAQTLGKLTGESLTGAVTLALREAIERRQGPEEAAGLARELLSIGRDCARRLKDPYRTIDHGDLLYDEKGMPK
jgi:antitoxin VapB